MGVPSSEAKRDSSTREHEITALRSQTRAALSPAATSRGHSSASSAPASARPASAAAKSASSSRDVRAASLLLCFEPINSKNIHSV